MRKYLNIISIIIVLGLIYPLNIFAEIKIVDDIYSETIPREYAFTPKFIENITTMEGSESYKKICPNINCWISARRKSDGSFDDYWAMYKNVGVWKRKIVDMKITLVDVVDTNPSSKCAYHLKELGEDIADDDYIRFHIMPKQLGIEVFTDCRSEGTTGIFKIEFFDNNTGEELKDLKSVLNYADIDGDERILLDNNRVKEMIYYKTAEQHFQPIEFSNDYTVLSGTERWTCTLPSGMTKDVECIKCINGKCERNARENTCLDQDGKNGNNDNCGDCNKSGMVTTLNEGSFLVGWGGWYVGFSAASLLRIEDPIPIKEVDKEKVKAKDEEEINYTIEQYVPNQSAEHYYKSWVLIDELESILETSIDNIKIRTNGNEDVTDKFNIILENNTLTISAKQDYVSSDEFYNYATQDEFYNRTFYIDIKAKVSKDTKGLKEIKNHTVLRIEYSDGTPTKDILSNEVTTMIEEEKIEEIIEVPNTAKFIGKIVFIVGSLLIISGILIIIKVKKNRLN